MKLNRVSTPLCLAFLALAFVLPDTAPMAQQSTAVRFQAGSDHVTLGGSITGHDYADYLLRARAGQTITASLTTVSADRFGTVYSDILPPGSDDTAIYVGSRDDEATASVTLPEDGRYIIRVYLMGHDRGSGKSVAFSLPVSID